MKNCDYIFFCENVRFLRKKYHLTQKEMAKDLKIGIKSLRALERGEIPKRLSCDILFSIHERFGILPKDQFWPLEKDEAIRLCKEG